MAVTVVLDEIREFTFRDSESFRIDVDQVLRVGNNVAAFKEWQAVYVGDPVV